MIGTIDTSPTSIRFALIIVLFFTWIYIYNHPSEEEE
jgi:hypothetical protein|tara:strand:+ start:560 stop:670 length:111 start_codon:yes stop_codon:yes gene_type:complete